MPEPKYKWESAREWLDQKVQSGDEQFVRGVYNSIIDKLDEDDIQEVFREEMNGDGFFDKVCICGQPLPCEHVSKHFKTTDGYTLFRSDDGVWTDGDLVFDEEDGYPVDEDGERLKGEMVEP